jgi:tetratricopeptide (TPR) repeat protein
MAIKGSLTEASLPDVIQLLTYSGKSGCLSVTDGRNFGNIFIKDGKIIYATILNKKQRLGDILLMKKLIDNETLSRALEIQKSAKKRRLGEILIELDALSKKVLEDELKGQIEQTIFTMLTWDSGYFNFEADLLPSQEDYIVQLSAQELLLEGARRIDEWRQIENKIPPFETVLVHKGEASDIPLTSEEKEILELIDGVRSIDEILKLSKIDFFETCRTIYGLLSAGLLEKPERPLESKKTTGDISEYKNLGFAFYKTEMYDESEREYKKILDIDDKNAEALFYLGLIELMRYNYNNARDYLLKALAQDNRASVLANLGYVCSKLELYDEALDYLRQAVDLTPENIRVKTNLAIIYYRNGDLENASKLFKELVEKSPEIISPYIYLPLIYLKQGTSELASTLLNDAIDRFPRFSFFKNNLAVLYESIDRPEDAEKLYRKALEAEPGEEVICRNLADFYYEAQILGAAKELYEKIPDKRQDWQVLFKLGNIFLRQGDSENALLMWEKAHQLNPAESIVARNIEVLKKSGGK